jgi:hypothetical protein
VRLCLELMLGGGVSSHASAAFPALFLSFGHLTNTSMLTYLLPSELYLLPTPTAPFPPSTWPAPALVVPRRAGGIVLACTAWCLQARLRGTWRYIPYPLVFPCTSILSEDSPLCAASNPGRKARSMRIAGMTGEEGRRSAGDEEIDAAPRLCQAQSRRSWRKQRGKEE